MRAALVLNPGARHGDLSPDDLVASLVRHGVEAEVFPVANGKDELRAALRSALERGHDTVIVGGGDGTLSTAADVLCDHSIRLGVIPLGTANDFACSLSIPADVDEACAVIGAGATQAVDVGIVNGRRFLNVVSIGLPAKVTAVLTPELKRRWGILAYAIAAVRAAIRQRPFSVWLNIDGKHQRVRRVVQLAVGSGRNYGGGMAVTDAAMPTDGYLNVHVITAPNLRALLWTLRHLRSGRYASGDSALRFRARAVRVATRRRHRLNADGELIGHTPLVVTVCPGCLHVFAPRQETE